MQPVTEDTRDENSDANSISPRTFWQRVIDNRPFAHPTAKSKIFLVLLIAAVLVIVVLLLYNAVPPGEDPGVVIDYPEEWDFRYETIKWIDDRVDWVVINWETFTEGINKVLLRYLLGPLEDFLLWLPWWFVFVITGLLAWRIVSARFAGIVVFLLGFMTIMGLLDLAAQTLAITLTSAFICVIFGLPIGIIAARSSRLDAFIRPVLDMMQTMPSFVYLIPAVMLFSMGATPAVMATCIYSIPPIIRLTNLGIRQVDTQVVEAARSFGVTAWQLLRKVQIPLALPTILAGVNQTIMMALAMVVLASMIGAAGLGVEVLTGLGRINPGQAFVGGISIVFLAIILDRISQGFAKRPEKRPAT